MLTLSDFKEKKILSIHTEFGHDNFLQFVNDNVRFIRDGETLNQISIHHLYAIFIVGDISITSVLLKKLTSEGVSVFFLNLNLSTKVAILAEAEGNYLLRQKQYTSNNELETATKIVQNKINSQESALQKYKRVFDKKIFNHAREMLASVENREQLLGIEGNVGKVYFQSFFEDVNWTRRAPQTKEDITNLLLDIGYTYLFNYCDALLRLFGFDTYKGCYHQLFFQRKSLVCDVMEPMRPLIDTQLLKSYHLKQIKEKDFVFKNGRFEFKDGFKTSKIYSSIFLELINTHKTEIYNFILGFYRYYMDKSKYRFPEFKVS